MLFFPLAFDASLNLESGDIEVKKIYGTNFENKMVELESGFGLKTHWLSAPSVKLTTEVLLFYFKKIKSKRLPKPVLCNVLDFLTYNKKVRNVCEISSCTATPMISDKEAKGKFFVIVAKLKDSKLFLNSKIRINTRFKLSYVDLTNPNNLSEVGKSSENQTVELTVKTIFKEFIIQNPQKIQVDKTMYNGLCLFYYNKFMRDICRKYNVLDESGSSRKFNGQRLPGLHGLSRFDWPDTSIDGVDAENLEIDDENENQTDLDPVEVEEKVDPKEVAAKSFLNNDNLNRCTENLKTIFNKGFYTDNPELLKNIFQSIELLREKFDNEIVTGSKSKKKPNQVLMGFRRQLS